MVTEVDVCTCQEDGQWSPQSISCCPRKCSLPGNITHVIVHGDNFTVSTNITLSCVEGYTLVGASTSTCKVYCYLHCFILQALSNSGVLFFLPS